MPRAKREWQPLKCLAAVGGFRGVRHASFPVPGAAACWPRWQRFTPLLMEERHRLRKCRKSLSPFQSLAISSSSPNQTPYSLFFFFFFWLLVPILLVSEFRHDPNSNVCVCGCGCVFVCVSGVCVLCVYVYVGCMWLCVCVCVLCVNVCWCVCVCV